MYAATAAGEMLLLYVLIAVAEMVLLLAGDLKM